MNNLNLDYLKSMFLACLARLNLLHFLLNYLVYVINLFFANFSKPKMSMLQFASIGLYAVHSVRSWHRLPTALRPDSTGTLERTHSGSRILHVVLAVFHNNNTTDVARFAKRLLVSISPF